MPLSIAVIAGDGIGPEVTNAALEVLDATGLATEREAFPFSAAHYLATGAVLTDADVDKLRAFDAILLGAVGGAPNDPRLAGGVIEKGILLKLRFDLDQYVNFRPVKLYPGIDTPLAGRGPEDIDFVCIRENTEGLYAGMGGAARVGTPQEVSTQTMLTTAFGVERCVRYAFGVAQHRDRKHLTLIHKTNVLTHAGATWKRVFDEVAADFPEVSTGYHHVDACCMHMVANPGQYDVLVVPNMFGDIITDLGAAIAGGMGIAASGNLNPDGTAPVDVRARPRLRPRHRRAEPRQPHRRHRLARPAAPRDRPHQGRRRSGEGRRPRRRGREVRHAELRRQGPRPQRPRHRRGDENGDRRPHLTHRWLIVPDDVDAETSSGARTHDDRRRGLALNCPPQPPRSRREPAPRCSS